MIRVFCALLVLVMSVALIPGCTSTQIAVKEAFGYAKREQLVDGVKAVRDSQGEAKKQFESALAEFMAVTGATGGELETKYTKLKREYETSETKAKAVNDRIVKVEAVSDALFAEWRKELEQYSTASLRDASERQLNDTKGQYDKLLASMKNAEAKMGPVLARFKDQVLFLKHNLNARAIASLQGTSAEIQTDVTNLVRDMEAAIAEANAFIDQMQGAKNTG